VNLVYSERKWSAAVRIPMHSGNPRAKRVEYRPPVPSANPYLAFAALHMAGVDGIERRIDPGAPMDVVIYALAPREASHISQVPASLAESLDALEPDHEFLLKGDASTPVVL
jgi:glutamine synthetase